MNDYTFYRKEMIEDIAVALEAMNSILLERSNKEKIRVKTAKARKKSKAKRHMVKQSRKLNRQNYGSNYISSNILLFRINILIKNFYRRKR